MAQSCNNMFNLRHLFGYFEGLNSYIWVEVDLIKETHKALLIRFNRRQEWLPKAWVVGAKRDKRKSTIKIKISEYNWGRKFQWENLN